MRSGLEGWHGAVLGLVAEREATQQQIKQLAAQCATSTEAQVVIAEKGSHKQINPHQR